MSSDIVLTAALRNNLLSLQNTQRLIDTTQLRLATGLKVSSALDDPQSFFTSQSLNNRASDLGRLLDGIGQSIRTIEEADNGITALTNLVEQAQSVVSSARDELASSEGEARALGTTDLSTTADLTTLANITTGDEVVISTTDDAGNQITETIAITTGDTAASFTANITNAFADNRNGEVTASITSDGAISIQSTNGRSFTLGTNAANTLAAAGFTDLGLGDIVELENDGTGTSDLAGATIVAGNSIQSISLYENAGDLIEAGDLIGGTYQDADGNTVIAGVDTSIVVAINNTPGTTVTFAAGAAATFQDFVDSINQDATVNTLISAEFDDATGQISITSLDDTVDNVQIQVTGTAGTTFNLGLGDATGNLNPLATTVANTADQTFSFNSSTEVLDSLAADYNTIRAQINDLVVDANYRGINLLNGDDLVTFFNENNTSTLTTVGATFTADGLGVTEATFRTSTEIELSATQSRDALEAVRSFGSSLANNLSIIQTRRDFTEQTINTLQAGADDLVVADQNEEGANLLALQTRQALGVTSLSLASQSQQSVLRLF